MSDYESHKGKLVKIRENLTKEEMAHFAKTELIHKNVKIPDYYEDVFEFIRDNTDKYSYFFGETTIYEIENYALDPDNEEFWYQNKGEEVNKSIFDDLLKEFQYQVISRENMYKILCFLKKYNENLNYIIRAYTTNGTVSINYYNEDIIFIDGEEI